MYCKYCSLEVVGDGRCPNSKFHGKFLRIKSLFKDGESAFSDVNSYRQSAYNDLHNATTVEDEIEAYKKLGYAYYIDFIRRKPNSSLTYETYMGLILNSGGLPELDKRKDAFNLLVNDFGEFFGFKDGSTYEFEDGVTRYLENTMFRAYTHNHSWVLVDKSTGVFDRVSEKVLREFSSKDFVFGYAKCLFYGNQE